MPSGRLSDTVQIGPPARGASGGAKTEAWCQELPTSKDYTNGKLRLTPTTRMRLSREDQSSNEGVTGMPREARVIKEKTIEKDGTKETRQARETRDIDARQA